MKTNISIADDHPLLLTGIAELLQMKGYHIVHQASGGEELIQSLRMSRPFPHICLVDYQMKEMNGLQTLQKIKENWPFIAVVMMTMNDDPDIRGKAISLGADGFILKGCEGEAFFDLIDEAIKVNYQSAYAL